MSVDWLSVCRGCVADIESVLAALPTSAEREPVLRDERPLHLGDAAVHRGRDGEPFVARHELAESAE